MSSETTLGKGSKDAEPVSHGAALIGIRQSQWGFELSLDDGSRIMLPPIARETPIEHLRIGDRLRLSPREDMIEGELRRFDDETQVVVARDDERLLGFVVADNLIVPSGK